ncbi:Lipid A core -O-antigen ligase [Hartmannibacter diazotrophicus]|uniref:Lipid A core -O-antigen ligase n=1 Tax=Hartmannibacter diazotrophicus TaxID=1482074 RepID=A0A2C9DCY4_9HYPH|nr:hypothetical protein [Hartmannibacter diazotrophicus]SON57988.1 Lipid A core -O-antigen ligase [Hartmannibacter diazotrophicus]
MAFSNTIQAQPFTLASEPGERPLLGGLCIILLASLLLQRIGLHAGGFPLPVALVAAPVVILLQAFLGISKISLVRLILFTGIAVTTTISAAFADPKASLTSGLLYVGLYGFFIFCIPVDHTAHERFYRTIVRIICFFAIIGILQYFVQYLVKVPFLFSWAGLVPSGFLIEYNTLNELKQGSGIYKANGFFLLEASALSQLASRGLLIAIFLLKDLRYVPILLLGMIVTFSGTGILLFAIFGSVALGLMILEHPKYRKLLWILPILLPLFVIFAWDQLNLHIFLARVGEFSDSTSSGYARFTGNAVLFLLFSKVDTFHFLFGVGPSMSTYYMLQADAESFASGWIKLVTEYGVVGFFCFAAFFYTCAYQATRRHVLASAFLFHWLVLDGNLLVPQHLFTAYCLCAMVQYNPMAAFTARSRNPRFGLGLPGKDAGGA